MKRGVKKGNIPWNKGIKCPSIQSARIGIRFSDEHIRNLAKSHLGHIPWNKGLKMPDISGHNHFNWKGGISRERQSLSNPKYIIWRNEIFKRDNYICNLCNSIGGKLVAHHIKEWSEFPKLRYVVNNGETLCEKCHKIIHSKNPMEKAINILMGNLKTLIDILLQDKGRKFLNNLKAI
jgi:hypothetical protein